MEATTNQNKMWNFFWRKLSYPPTTYQRIQDKNWSHRVIFSYWTHHEPHDISKEEWRIRIWSNYYAKDEVTQLGSNRGVWLAIANQPVARSGTEVHKDWWHIQELVMISQFSRGGVTKDEGSTKQNSTWRCWLQQGSYEESNRNSRITPSRMLKECARITIRSFYVLQLESRSS
jgi:hypothetical protein